jgi:hypothetical protein
MSDETNLPGLPSTVDLGAPAATIEGDPLAFMQKAARDAIESISKNAIVDEPNKLEFKKRILNNLKVSIDKMTEIDNKFAAKKAEEEANKPEGEAAEEDPFSDIFGEEGSAPDESVQEKTKVAQEFVSNLKLFKEQFLRNIRIKKETMQKQKDEKELENLLGKLNTI